MSFFPLPDVEKLKNNNNIDGLIRSLNRKNSSIRKSAAMALGSLGDQKAIKPLTKLLYDIDTSVRIEAICAIGKLDNTIIEPFIPLLKDTDDQIRAAAIVALGKQKNQRVIPIIGSALKDKSHHIRGIAAKTLGNIGEAEAISFLRESLKDSNEEVKSLSFESLGKIGPPAFEVILAEIKNDQGFINQKAIEILGTMGDKRAIKPLIHLLPTLTNNWGNQYAVSNALKMLEWQPTNDEIGAYYWIGLKNWEECISIGKSAVIPLGESIDFVTARYGRADARTYSIIRCLGAIGGKVAQQYILKVLDIKYGADEFRGNPYGVDHLREYAIQELGNIADETLIEYLCPIMRKPGWGNVRLAAAQAIRNIAKSSPEVLIKEFRAHANSELSYDLIEIMGDIGDARFVEPLINLINIAQKSSFYNYEPVAKALGKIGDSRAIEFLNQIKNNKNASSDARKSATEAIEKISQNKCV